MDSEGRRVVVCDNGTGVRPKKTCPAPFPAHRSSDFCVRWDEARMCGGLSGLVACESGSVIFQVPLFPGGAAGFASECAAVCPLGRKKDGKEGVRGGPIWNLKLGLARSTEMLLFATLKCSNSSSDSENTLDQMRSRRRKTICSSYKVQLS